MKSPNMAKIPLMGGIIDVFEKKKNKIFRKIEKFTKI